MVTATAPCRLDFAGGWTDVEPFASDRGGLVVNAAIDIRAQATVELGVPHHTLVSHDLNQSLELRTVGDLASSGTLDLLKAAIRLSGCSPCRLVTESAAPPGSGLGSSGALDVAMIAALDRAMGRESGPSTIAEHAWRLEAVEAGLPGGKQDQYAAALGGIQQLTFRDGNVAAAPLCIETAFLEWMQRQIVVCYTGQSRVSGDTIRRVMNRYRAGDAAVTSALHGLADCALEVSDALTAADPARLARAVSRNWQHQRALDPEMQTPLMARLEVAMAGAGALGGKAVGAGAGGAMFFILGGDVGPARDSIANLGLTQLPLNWSDEGVRVW